jgi:hypothetical protein
MTSVTVISIVHDLSHFWVQYYTVSGFDERYVHQLTFGLMQSAVRRVMDQFQIADGELAVGYMPSKNLNFEVDITRNTIGFICDSAAA